MRPLVLLPLALTLACKPDVAGMDFTEAAHHPHAAFMSVGGTGPKDVWLVGAQPTPSEGPVVLHGGGDGWEKIETGQLHDLWWVHAVEGGPTFLGGAGATILKVDGDAITRLPSPGFAGLTVYGMWAASEDDLWAVGGWAGRAGFVWHWDGAAWTDIDLPADLPRSVDGEIPGILKVWGRSSSDVWMVGGLGTILHWDGAALTRVPGGTTEQLFTVSGDDHQVWAVGGGSRGVVLRGGVDGFHHDTPPFASLLQGLTVADGQTWVAGQAGEAFVKAGDHPWQRVDLQFATPPGSVHALWSDGEGGIWAAGGNVLSTALDEGVACSSTSAAMWEPEVIPPPLPACPADEVDPFPTGSIARRWNEQLLNSIRRDIPHPPKHARNLFHTSVALYDAWAAYQDVADGYVYTDRESAVDVEQARRVALSYAAYRVLKQRFTPAQGAGVTLTCYDDFMGVLGLDPSDTHTDGADPIAVGNRVGQAVIDAFLDDGANEAKDYADTTGWTRTNPVLVVDRPGVPPTTDPDTWQQLNLALAETQNGIVLDDTVQPYIGAHWRDVLPFAAEVDPGTGLHSDPGPSPVTADADMAAWLVEVIQKTAWLDPTDGALIDTSPGSMGNNPLGTNDGHGYPTNPVTGLPYAPQRVPRGDYARVMAEMWADGPRSETPPGHWARLANEVSDALDPDVLRPFADGPAVDRLAWDVSLYLTVTGATHDAAITAWEVKREHLGPRPISLIRWMADHGQRTDPGLPSYDPNGLPLVDGLIELITEASAAVGERHHHLRWYVGELAVRSWPGEPGDRAHDYTPIVWMRARDWIPYQRRTFVTPAFPGFTSGHSTFSRAAAEALTRFTGSPYFPGGLAEFVAPQNAYLVFEDGPTVDVHLQWASYYDAADQAGQSRLWGGIHIWPDDAAGRLTGSIAGEKAADLAERYWTGTAR